MKILLSIALTLACLNVHAQEPSKIFTSDIDNFWVAYDSIRQVDDFTEKLGIINRLYIDRGTPGLQAFMKARDYNDTQYVKLIDVYPKFWDSIRTNTLSVKDKTISAIGCTTVDKGEKMPIWDTMSDTKSARRTMALRRISNRL